LSQCLYIEHECSQAPKGESDQPTRSILRKSSGKSNNGHRVTKSRRPPPATMRREPMAFWNPRLDLYDPKTLAVMDQVFAAIWAIIRGHVRDYANDGELRIAVGRKLLKPSSRWSDRSYSASAAHYREPISSWLLQSRTVGADRNVHGDDSLPRRSGQRYRSSMSLSVD
jgi:hypothetical protein